MISRQTNYLKGAITKMKRLFASVISCVLILSMICSGLTVFATTITGAVDTDNFVRGVDVSTLDMLEDLGARYYQNNVESDALTILKKMLIDLTQQATISRKSPIYWTDRMLQCSQKQKGEHHHGTYS